MKSQISNQQSLFPVNWDEMESNFQNIKFKARLLHQKQLLSFNPDEVKALHDDHFKELQFLKTLFFDTGLPESYVQAMLNSNLQKPYCYNLSDLFWDFNKAKWIFLADLVEERFQDYFQEKEEEDEGDDDSLNALRDLVKNLSKKRGFDDENFSPADSFAIDFLINYFDELVKNSKRLKINFLNRFVLLKALFLFEYFGRISFDGNLRIDSIRKGSGKSLVSHIVNITQDEISLTREGWEDNELGGDSYFDEYFVIGFNDDNDDILNLMDSWKAVFQENIELNMPGLEIEDDTSCIRLKQNHDDEGD